MEQRPETKQEKKEGITERQKYISDKIREYNRKLRKYIWDKISEDNIKLIFNKEKKDLTDEEIKGFIGGYFKVSYYHKDRDKDNYIGYSSYGLILRKQKNSTKERFTLIGPDYKEIKNGLDYDEGCFLLKKISEEEGWKLRMGFEKEYKAEERLLLAQEQEAIKNILEQLQKNPETQNEIEKELVLLIKQRDDLVKQEKTLQDLMEKLAKKEAGLKEYNEKFFKRKKTEKNKEKEIEEIKINIDKIKRPFLYFLAGKCKNSFISKGKLEDLTWLKWEGTLCLGKDLYKITEDTGYFEWSISGFTMIIKNVEKTRNENGIDAYSNKAIYKIVGPDGSIVQDDIEGYDKANEIYKKSVNEYEKRMLEEFKEEINIEIINTKIANLKNAFNENNRNTSLLIEELKKLGYDTTNLEKKQQNFESARNDENPKETEQEKNKNIYKEILDGNFDNVSQLTELTDVKVAEALAGYEGPVPLNGLQNITVEVAEALSKHKDYPLSLNGLQSIDVKVAEALSKCQSSLSLCGLQNITVEVAEALSKYQGTHLSLGDLEKETREVVDILKRNPNINFENAKIIEDDEPEGADKHTPPENIEQKGITKKQKYILDQINETNVKLIFNKEKKDLTEEEIDNFLGNGDSVYFTEIKETDVESIRKHGVVYYSSNGFILLIDNQGKLDSPTGDSVDFSDEKAKFTLIGPDYKEIENGLDYNNGVTILKKYAEQYQYQEVSNSDFEEIFKNTEEGQNFGNVTEDPNSRLSNTDETQTNEDQTPVEETIQPETIIKTQKINTFWKNGNKRIEFLQNGTENRYWEDGTLELTILPGETRIESTEDPNSGLSNTDETQTSKDQTLVKETIQPEIKQEDQHLHKETLENGTILYKNEKDEVRFRLDINGNLFEIVNGEEIDLRDEVNNEVTDETAPTIDGEKEYWVKSPDGTEKVYDRDTGRLYIVIYPDETIKYYNTTNGRLWYVKYPNETIKYYNTTNGRLGSVILPDGIVWKNQTITNERTETEEDDQILDDTEEQISEDPENAGWTPEKEARLQFVQKRIKEIEELLKQKS